MDKPQFDTRVFVLGRRSRPVPTNSHLLLDLVFDIRANENLQYWTLRITRIDLEIPIAKYTPTPTLSPDDTFTNRPLLNSESPEGPAPLMLYNIRFNVIRKGCEMRSDGGVMYVSIVPRTSFGIATGTFDEASFQMPLAGVYPWKVPEGMEYPFQIKMKAFMRDAGAPDNVKDSEYDYVISGTMDSPGNQ